MTNAKALFTLQFSCTPTGKVYDDLKIPHIPLSLRGFCQRSQPPFQALGELVEGCLWPPTLAFSHFPASASLRNGAEAMSLYSAGDPCHQRVAARPGVTCFCLHFSCTAHAPACTLCLRISAGSWEVRRLSLGQPHLSPSLSVTFHPLSVLSLCPLQALASLPSKSTLHLSPGIQVSSSAQRTTLKTVSLSVRSSILHSSREVFCPFQLP